MVIQIVLCADDFGFSPAVSQGILELVQAGRLSATSCMTASPHFSESVGKLKVHEGDIDIGLHLVLTDLKPLGAMPGLTVGGRLPPVGSLIKRALRGLLPTQEVREELGRQMDAFEAIMGRTPDFVDGHHHIHQLPGIRDIVIDLMAKRYVKSPPWLRVCSERPVTLLRRGVSIGRAIAIGWFGAALRRRATQKGFRVNAGFSGVYDLSDRIPYGQLFDRFTLGVRSGALIMCHPGHVDETLRAIDGLTDQRVCEYTYFMSDNFQALLDSKVLRLGRLE